MPTKATGYASLQPHTAHVSRARIQKTWRPLPPPTQERVKQLLLSLQKESQAQRRSANLRLNGRQNKNKNKNKKTKKQKGRDEEEEEQEESSEQAVREVVDKLIRRIPRMPFPRQHNHNNSINKSTPGGGSSYEADFDFEATLDRIQRLEAELAETMESSKLLREQIRREEAAVRADREEYKMLEAGARSEQSLAREQARKLHPVAREVDMNADADADADEMEVEEFDFDFDEDQGGEGEEEEERAGLSRQAGAEEAVRWTMQAQKQKKSSSSSRAAGGLTKSEIEQDKQLKTLVARLRRHVNSIAKNTAGLASVSDALDDAEQAIWELMATTTTTTTTAAAGLC